MRIIYWSLMILSGFQAAVALIVVLFGLFIGETNWHAIELFFAGLIVFLVSNVGDDFEIIKRHIAAQQKRESVRPPRKPG